MKGYSSKYTGKRNTFFMVFIVYAGYLVGFYFMHMYLHLCMCIAVHMCV